MIEIFALSILCASFLITMHFQDKKKLLREAVFPYIFSGVFLVNIKKIIIFLNIISIYYQ
jgi:hypothetical protein